MVVGLLMQFPGLRQHIAGEVAAAIGFVHSAPFGWQRRWRPAGAARPGRAGPRAFPRSVHGRRENPARRRNPAPADETRPSTGSKWRRTRRAARRDDADTPRVRRDRPRTVPRPAPAAGGRGQQRARPAIPPNAQAASTRAGRPCRNRPARPAPVAGHEPQHGRDLAAAAQALGGGRQVVYGASQHGRGNQRANLGIVGQTLQQRMPVVAFEQNLPAFIEQRRREAEPVASARAFQYSNKARLARRP